MGPGAPARWLRTSVSWRSPRYIVSQSMSTVRSEVLDSLFDAVSPLFLRVGIGYGLTARNADRAVPIELTSFPAVIWLWGIPHASRQHFLTGSWRTAQPKRIRVWMIRLPGKLTTHERKTYLQLLPPTARLSRRPSGSWCTVVGVMSPAASRPTNIRVMFAIVPACHDHDGPLCTDAPAPPPPNRH